MMMKITNNILKISSIMIICYFDDNDDINDNDRDNVNEDGC
jgi:hypothetical protein